MSYLSKQPKSRSVADQILDFLAAKPHQSAVDISFKLGYSYWHCREVASRLVKEGQLVRVMVGKSPHYSAPSALTDADQHNQMGVN
jgi:hypothetical protein